ncbi:O-antigen ligase family protein [Streptomyces sp. HNM0575]|uniref:O-antigen ligase family protein n=1 Tax=Streptomyces sp. HNM0575 TaxID=2716338 RepID=UPI001F109B98|nr:O-antigen ligase family protein [Streptomyces sp. HNM0575]
MAPAVATVLVLCAPVRTGDVTTSGKITAADAASMVLVVWCLVRLLRGRGGRLTPRAAVVLGAPAVAFAVATAASADPWASVPGFVRCLQIFVLVPGALLLLLRGARDFRLLCWSVIVLALVQGTVGVVQSLTGTGASYMGKNVRAVGTFGPLDVMGMSTVVSLGLVAAFALSLAYPADCSRRQRITAMCCAFALLPPLVLSYSRGAWIATAVACTTVLVLAGVRRAVAVLLALVAASVVLVGGFGVGSAMVTERLTSIADIGSAPDRSVTDRYSLWSAATGIWQDSPVTGVGPKNFAAQRDGHATLGLSSGSDTAGAGMQFQKEPLLSPHNMYLLVLSEQGLVGITALVGGGGVLLVCGLRRVHAAHRARQAHGYGGWGGGSSYASGPDATASDVRVSDAPGSYVPDSYVPDSCAPGSYECGLAAAGLLVWQAVDFLYADIGGPSTVLTAVVLGGVAWWALASPADGDSAADAGDAGDAGEAGYAEGREGKAEAPAR